MRESATTLEAEMSPRELELLRASVAGLPPPARVLEIGTAAGGSLVHILTALRGAGHAGRVTSIDPMTYVPDQRAIVERNLARHGFGPDDVELRVLRSADALAPARAAGERYELIFIDANHGYRHVVADLRWTALLEPHGRLLLHDYATIVGVRVAVDEFVARNPYYRRVAVADTTIALERDPGARDRYRAEETSAWDVTRAALLHAASKNLKKLGWDPLGRC
jgi:predicted O-methyltransferase YrrM